MVMSEMITAVQNNFVAWWKAASIVVAGILGVLGYLSDFRDGTTREITRRGWVLLSLVVIATLFGVAAQIVETHDNAKAERKAIEATLRIVQNTSETVTSLNRVMSNFVDAKVDVTFSTDCNDEQSPLCAGGATTGSDQELKFLSTATLYAFFFKNPSTAKQFTDGGMVTTRWDLGWFLKGPGANGIRFGSSYGKGGGLRFEIFGYAAKPIQAAQPQLTLVGVETGKVLSLADLSGCTVIVLMANPVQLPHERIEFLDIRIRNGQSVYAGPFNKITFHPAGEYALQPNAGIAYRYVFPEIGPN